ncbi:DUF3592 domain-containing protein [Aquimarina litoralis]|uniref:DUF3592 domain-containing protein n=1 Tax=Aquimarina litoralis TaxID=584605 RepID=UPI001FE6312B|nr:DUF3592 domain-containing protein [Aquimarina litoralis]MBW1296900.1 hypothetical protein [Aquimarina litoralis]
MTIYMTIIVALLLSYTLYVGYLFFVFKYQSVTVNAIVVLSQADKVLKGGKKAIKIGLSYTIDGKNYSEVKTTSDIDNVKIGSSVPLQVLKNNPQKCTIHSDQVRLQRVIIALALLIIAAVASYFL